MAIKYINRVVDLDGNSVSESLPASFFDGEASAHMFTISARRGGEALALSGTVSATFFNANETVVTISGSIVNGAAVVTLSDACYEVTGRFIFTISVAGAVIYECNSRIKRRQSSTIYDPTGELSAASIAQDIADMEAATAAAEAAAEAVEIQVDGLLALAGLKDESYSYSGVTISHLSISNAGKWTSNSAQDSYTFAIPATVKTIKVTGGANGSIIAFLDTYSDSQEAGTDVDFATGFTARITLAANETKTYVVSGDMNYFFALLKDTSSNDKTPTVALGYTKTDTTLTQSHVPADGKATGDALSAAVGAINPKLNYLYTNAARMQPAFVLTGKNQYASYDPSTGVCTMPAFAYIYTDKEGSTAGYDISGKTASVPATHISRMVLYYDVENDAIAFATAANYMARSAFTPLIAMFQFSGANSWGINVIESYMAFSYDETQAWRDEIYTELHTPIRESGAVEFTYESSSTLNRVRTIKEYAVTAGEIYLLTIDVSIRDHPELFKSRFLTRRIYFFDSNNTEIKNVETKYDVIPITVPTGCAKIRISAVTWLSTAPQSSYTDYLLYDYCLKKYDGHVPVSGMLKLKCCSYNAGMYNYGSSSRERQYTAEKDAAVRQFIAGNNFDILATQENPSYSIPGGGATSDAYSQAFGWFYRAAFTSGGSTVTSSMTISSKYPITNERAGYFTAKVGDNNRWWMIVDALIGDRVVAIANVHPAYQDTTEGATVRAAQFQEIISMLTGYDYAIIFGDFNAQATSEFSAFTDAGYTLSNGGYCPFENTYPVLPSQNVTDMALDNVIVRSPVSPVCHGEKLDAVVADVSGTVADVDKYVSDHFPFMANVTIG